MDTGIIINAIATFFAAISAWAAYVTVRQARQSEDAARSERASELATRRRSFRWRIVPALYQVLIEARAAQELVKIHSDHSHPRTSVAAKDLHLWLNYAPRLFELEGDLGLLPEDEAKTISVAIESVRQYEAFVARFAGPNSDVDPFGYSNFPTSIEPFFQRLTVKVEEAM